MLHFTLIARQTDALALCADTESGNGASADMERNKVVAKNLLRKISTPSPTGYFGQAGVAPLLTVEASAHAFHLLCDGGVLFLTMTDSSSPSAIAFAYLEDVAREFLQQDASQVATCTRPYSFIKFDMYLQKTKKVFSSATSARSAAALQRSGRPLAVKRQFREVMGFADGAASKEAQKSDNTVVAVGVAVVVGMVMIACVVIYLVL